MHSNGPIREDSPRSVGPDSDIGMLAHAASMIVLLQARFAAVCAIARSCGICAQQEPGVPFETDVKLKAKIVPLSEREASGGNDKISSAP